MHKYLYVPSGSETVQVTCPGCQEVWAWPPMAQPSNAGPQIGVTSTVVIHLCKNCLHTLDITKTYQQPICPKCGTDCADGGIQVVRDDEASRSVNLLLLQVLGTPPLSDEQNQAILTIASHAHADTRIVAPPDTGIKHSESPVSKPEPDDAPDNTDDKVIISCPSCAEKLHLPSGLGAIHLPCPSCRKVWEWPAGRVIIVCPTCRQNVYAPIVAGMIQVTCPNCKTPVICSTGRDAGSDPGIAGWLLLLLSVAVTALVAFSVVMFVPTLQDWPRRTLIVIVVIPSAVTGVVLFCVGGWLLEKMLNIIGVKKPPS